MPWWFRVSVTGLPITPAIEAMRARGVLNRLPMFEEILEGGVRWPDGTVLRAGRAAARELMTFLEKEER